MLKDEPFWSMDVFGGSVELWPSNHPGFTFLRVSEENIDIAQCELGTEDIDRLITHLTNAKAYVEQRDSQERGT